MKLHMIRASQIIGLLVANTVVAQSEPRFQPRTGQHRTSESSASVSQDLLLLYAETKTVRNEADVTALARTCSRIVPDTNRSQLDRDYAGSLLAWALNRRGEMRSERAAKLVEGGQLTEANALDQQAALDFETAIEYGPANWRSRHNFGISLAMKGDYPRAVQEFSMAIQLKPDYANSYFNRAELYFEGQQYERALIDYTQAIELDAGDPQYFNSRGHCRFMMAVYEEALADYRRATEIGNDSAVYQTDLADACQFLGQWKDAATAYRAALSLDGSYPRAYQNASWLMATCPDASIRNVELALSTAKKALELDGAHSARALDTLAAATAAGGSHGEAVRLQRQAVQHADNDERAEMTQRLTLYEQGQAYIQPRPMSSATRNPQATTSRIRTASNNANGSR